MTAIPLSDITAVKVFTATLARDRAALGEDITRWIAEHPELELARYEIAQSSDSEYHCLSIVLFMTCRRRIG